MIKCINCCEDTRVQIYPKGFTIIKKTITKSKHNINWEDDVILHKERQIIESICTFSNK